MFLAILEMARLHAVVLRQEESFGDILLKKGPKFTVLFEEGALASAMGALREDALEEEEPRVVPEDNEPESTN